jgi:DNA-directed RNA polymerase beta subunit
MSEQVKNNISKPKAKSKSKTKAEKENGPVNLDTVKNENKSKSSHSISTSVLSKYEKDRQLTDGEFKIGAWNVIESFFTRGYKHSIMKHVYDSYNDFVLRKIEQVIETFNPITAYHNKFNDNIKKFKYKYSIYMRNPKLAKPVINEKDGYEKLMTPNDARNRIYTYSAMLSVDIEVNLLVTDEQYNETPYQQEIKNVNLGKIPIMYDSNYCIMNDTNVRASQNECRYDPGGYFIVNGTEKIIISQDRISENKTFVFIDNKNLSYAYVAEIRSVTNEYHGTPKVTSIMYTSKSNVMGQYIIVDIFCAKNKIPLFVLFRALGVLSDESIMKYIAHDLESPIGKLLVNHLRASAMEGASITTEDAALVHIMNQINISGHQKELLAQPEYKKKELLEILKKDFLPHVGNEFKQKALYLGFMVRKLILCSLKLLPMDNRDSYMNKRIDTPGILMTKNFCQFYNKMVKDFRNMIYKEIKSGTWKTIDEFINVININNIYNMVKTKTIEGNMRYSLATGNWSQRNDVSKSKQGVAQVKNCQNLLAAISHPRRSATSLAKAGKITVTRQLHSTHFGNICSSESPEGAAIGLVKNLSSTVTITIATSLDYVYRHLTDIGVTRFDGFNFEELSKNTKLILNENIIGFHSDPVVLYKRLKNMKYSGKIHIMTSVIWNHRENSISLCSNAGRCVRPLFLVNPETKDINLTYNTLLRLRKKEIDWNYLLNPTLYEQCENENENENNKNHNIEVDTREDDGKEINGCDEKIISPILEYIDTEEANSSLIAMTYADLHQNNTQGLRYTHMELHESMMLGILAAHINFSDHNPAPRNTYQCLDYETMVLMADGTKKMIKDVKIGDKVITFDPITLKQSNTDVVYQMVQPTEKQMYEIETISRRKIKATFDHKFMTNNGWQQVEDFNDETKLVIYNDKDLTDTNSKFESIKSKTKISNNRLIADITTESNNHSFIASDGFAVHNSAMCKQSIGISCMNFRSRMETISHVLTYPQRPFVSTKIAKLIGTVNMPTGINSYVAIMTCRGFNQEDSILINKDSLNRGYFSSTSYRGQRDACSKDHANGQEEAYCNAKHKTSKSKPMNYDKIEDDGFPKLNTYLKNGDILISKVMQIREHNNGGNIVYKDNSIPMKNNEEGFVNRVDAHNNSYPNINADGYKTGRISIRNYKIPVVGDKFASSHAQKGGINVILT